MRVVAIAVAGFTTLRFGDSKIYLRTAATIARTGHYPLRTDRHFFFRPPGYPSFLTVVTLGDPARVGPAKVANALVGSLACLVLAAISARIFRRRAVAVATGIAASLHPGLVFLSIDVQSEPLFLLLLLCSGFHLLAAVDRPSSGLALVAGGFLALAALTRSSALALVPLLLAPLFDRRYPFRARSHIAASALLGFGFTLGPWTLRNALVFHEPILVNDAAGLVVYYGNNEAMRRFYEVRTTEELRGWMDLQEHRLRERLAEMPEDVRNDPGRRSRAFVRLALEELGHDPSVALKLYAQKLGDWLRPYPRSLYWPGVVVWTTGVISLALIFLATAGLIETWRPGVRAFSIGFLAVTMIVHVCLLPNWRYRAPYWDPILILFAVEGAWRISGRLQALGRAPASLMAKT